MAVPVALVDCGFPVLIHIDSINNLVLVTTSFGILSGSLIEIEWGKVCANDCVDFNLCVCVKER